MAKKQKKTEGSVVPPVGCDAISSEPTIEVKTDGELTLKLTSDTRVSISYQEQVWIRAQKDAENQIISLVPRSMSPRGREETITQYVERAINMLQQAHTTYETASSELAIHVTKRNAQQMEAK